METISSTSTIEFRGHTHIAMGKGAGFNFSNALKEVTLLTQAEYDALEDDKKVPFKLIQHRDLAIIERNFGKEDEALGKRQGQAIINLFGDGLRVRDGNVATHAGMKSPLGLLLTIEAMYGRFDADYSDESEEIETKQGRLLVDFLGLRLKPNGRVDMEGGDKTPLGLIRTLRRVVKETK